MYFTKEIYFSVIVPVYNIEKYISQCVDSILNQSLLEIEVVLIDDGSLDNSGKICDRYAELDSRVHVYHKNNQGLSAARNDGISFSHGKYVVFLDGDDWFDNNNVLQTIKEEIEESDCPTVLICGRNTCKDGTNNIIKCEYVLPQKQSKQDGLTLFKTLIDMKSVFLGAQVFVVSKEYLIEKDLMFYKGIYYEDNLWIAQLLADCNNVACSNTSLFCYRTSREGSIMSNISSKKLLDRLLIINILNNDKTNLCENKKDIISYWQSKILVRTIIDSISNRSLVTPEIISNIEMSLPLLKYENVAKRIYLKHNYKKLKNRIVKDMKK